jgi:ATP-dependent Clp protease ATP-binding subunit ClpB
MREPLNPQSFSPEAMFFSSLLKELVIGQDRAIRAISRAYQVFLSGLCAPGRPVFNMLMLGPTGSGKTRMVEAMAEVLFKSREAMLKIDCAEFQHNHEIAKLIGSPPGYVGHRETTPYITQKALDQYQTSGLQVSLVLFDEIEKASDSLWQLLLGILDKATLTLGDNTKVNFDRSFIFLTSNLGASEIYKFLRGGMGLYQPPEAKEENDQAIYRMAVKAARGRFSPEFMNRIDKVVVFRTLQHSHLERILDIELKRVQDRITGSDEMRKFVFVCTQAAKQWLIKEGTDSKNGARPLKRVIERHVVFPLSSMVSSGQIGLGDMVEIDEEDGALKFYKIPHAAEVGSWQQS